MARWMKQAEQKTASAYPVVSKDPGPFSVSRNGSGPTLSAKNEQTNKGDRCTVWQRENAERLTVVDLAAGLDAGGFCAAHHRALSYPEQQRGACSWCVPVDPEREPEYWASHWRRFTGRP